ncbi:hypothetical protein FRC12_006534 [Ceratobasidium sp. 428]|nr:hypothetical protein FRC12_006534 [Ceratobasidium sp. 428]
MTMREEKPTRNWTEAAAATLRRKSSLRPGKRIVSPRGSTIKILSIIISLLSIAFYQLTPAKMDPFPSAAGSIFAPPPRPYLPTRATSASPATGHLASTETPDHRCRLVQMPSMTPSSP